MTKKESPPREIQATKELLCAIYGHTRIMNVDWGRVCCARCNKELADGLMYEVPNDDWVLPEHVCGKGCKNCAYNRKKLAWHEKILVNHINTEKEYETHV